MESKSRPLGELADLGLFRIRPMLTAQVPGTISFSPFGSNTRAIVITVDPDRLRAHNFTPEDVVNALETGNVVVPSGNLYARGEMPLVPTNTMVADPQEMGMIPVKLGTDVYIRDVGTRDEIASQLRWHFPQDAEQLLGELVNARAYQENRWGSSASP
jgi:multidrug efflux pump subunit AcrB